MSSPAIQLFWRWPPWFGCESRNALNPDAKLGGKLGVKLRDELGAKLGDGLDSELGEKFDSITASAPFERVNLVAVRRPRLGGKEPSNVDYRMRFSPALSADRDDGYRDRRVGGAATGARKRRGAGLLRQFAEARAGGHGSDRLRAMV